MRQIRLHVLSDCRPQKSQQGGIAAIRKFFANLRIALNTIKNVSGVHVSGASTCPIELVGLEELLT